MSSSMTRAAALQREDYVSAASLRDKIKQEQGVDAGQLKYQLQGAIEAENYKVRLSMLSIVGHQLLWSCSHESSDGGNGNQSECANQSTQLQEAARLRDLLSEVGGDEAASEHKEVTFTSTAVTRNIRVTATR